MKKNIKILTILGVGLFALASCGDGSSETTTPVSVLPSVATTDSSTNSVGPSVAESVSEQIESFIVTFNVNDGLGTVAPQTCEKGTFASEPTEAITKAHYELLGWTLVKDTLPVFDFAETAIEESITLYAYWSIDVYDVNFYLNYLTGTEDLYASENVEYNAVVGQPAVDPTREHYTFDKWYTEATCENEFVFTNAIDGNLDLFAGWIIDKVQVTFETFGGLGVSPSTLVDYGSKVTRPETDPTRENAIFDDWYMDELCTVAFDFDEEITSNVTIYAGYLTAYQIGSIEVDLTGNPIGMKDSFNIATTGLGFVVLNGTNVEIRGQLFAIQLGTTDIGIDTITGYPDVTLEFKVYRENQSGVMEYLDPSLNGDLVNLKLASSEYGVAMVMLQNALVGGDYVTAAGIYTEMQKMYAFEYGLDDGGMIDLFQVCVVNSVTLQSALEIDPADMSDYFYPLHISVAEPGTYCVRIWLETDVGANDIAYKQINFVAE